MTAHIDTPSGIAAGSIELIDAPLISPNPQNPRKHFDEASLQELADSMKPVGHNTVPVLVRPVGHWYCKPWRESRADGFAEVWRVTDRRIPETDANAGLLLQAPAFGTLEEAERNLPRYELVYGERRWRACVLAGYPVLAMVREMSDQDSLEAAVIENLQRQDISAMEEAQGFQALIDRGGYTADTLAEKLGKSRSHVFARLRLLKLHPKVQEALAAGDVEASVADLIAKFPTAIQSEALKELQTHWMAKQHGVLSFRQAKAVLEEYWPKLKTAPWKPKQEAKLPGGPCAECPKNSINMPDLASSPGVCTDRHCFADKVSALCDILASELEAKGAKIVPADEAAKLFRHGDHIGYGSDYELATEKVWDAKDYDAEDDKDPPSWQALLKDTDVPILSAIAPSGKVVKVVEVKAARAALVAKGVIKAVRGGQEASPEEKRKLREKNRRDRFVHEKVAKKCIESLTEAHADERFSFAVACLLKRSYRGAKFLREKHQIECQDLGELYRSLQRLPTLDVAEVLIVNECMQGPNEWNGYELSADKFPGALGVDVKAVTKKAEKEYETEAKAKKTKAKPQSEED